MHRSWDNPAWRSRVIYELARSLSKTGSFFLTGGIEFLASLRLDQAEVVALYEAIRDSTGRLELEWRPEFEAAFPQVAGQLPAVSPLGFRTFWESVLFDAIVANNVELLRESLAAFHEAGISLGSLGPLAPESLMVGIPVGWGPGNDPDVGLTFFQIAERVSSDEVRCLLREAQAVELRASADGRRD